MTASLKIATHLSIVAAFAFAIDFVQLYPAASEALSILTTGF